MHFSATQGSTEHPAILCLCFVRIHVHNYVSSSSSWFSWDYFIWSTGIFLLNFAEWASFITLLAGRQSQPRQAALCWEAPGSFRNLHNLLHVALPCFISLYVCCWILLPLLPDPQILELSTNCGNCTPLKLFRVTVLHVLCTHCYHSYLQGNDAFRAHGTHFSRVHVSTIISFRPKIHFIHGLRWTQQIGRLAMHGFS